MASTRTPQTTPVIIAACGLRRASAKNFSKVVPSARWALRAGRSKPVSHSITWSSSALVRPFFSTFVT
jgi:hypothetical protein